MMEEKQGKVLRMIMAAILLVSMYFVAGEGAAYVNSDNVTDKGRAETEPKREKICVVIDAGHGGADPGKVGVNGSLEKDINLKIAEMVKSFLEAEDVEVVMTRTDDGGLYDEGASNKKVQDMKRRIAVIEEADPAIVVSIHQNSYPDASVSGVQVFYYKDSVKGKEAAEIMQSQLIKTLKPEKERVAKDNSSYYLLKKTSVPIMIVECAFMSNPAEAELLTQEDYQERVAWAIYMGIMQVINS